jgi:hypothetical protein
MNIGNDHQAYRCYGMMDQRGRWGGWLFVPATAQQLRIFENQALLRKQVMFLSVQTGRQSDSSIKFSLARSIAHAYFDCHWG